MRQSLLTALVVMLAVFSAACAAQPEVPPAEEAFSCSAAGETITAKINALDTGCDTDADCTKIAFGATFSCSVCFNKNISRVEVDSEVTEYGTAGCPAVTARCAEEDVACACVEHACTPRVGELHKVDIRNFVFMPSQILVQVGDIVTWTNRDIVEHSVTSDLFDSGLLSKGESWNWTATESGKVTYYCSEHPWDIGTIIVSE